MTSAPTELVSCVLAHDQQGKDTCATTAPGNVVRVCFVIDNLARAGTESQVLLLLKQLDRKKICPYLCLLDGQDDISRDLEPLDVPTLRLGVRRLASPHALRQAWKFWRFLRSNRIDVLQAYFADSTRFAAPIARAAGVRAVFGSRRNIGHWMTKKDRWLARTYNGLFIDKIIANCEAARQATIEQEGARPEQVIVIPNGIDLTRFQHIPPWQPKPAGVSRMVGMVGNLREVKGPDLFIQAARLVLLKHPDVMFTIAGGGNPVPYQALIDECGLTEKVRLLGEVENVPAFLAALDVAVLPSRAEGLSNALLEYMAASRPIVATDVGGNAELIRTGVNGLLVEPKESSLSQGIDAILASPVLATTLAGTNCRLIFQFDARNSVDKLESLYQSATRANLNSRLVC